MIYLLNSAVLPDYGTYHFKGPLSVRDAKHLLESDFISAIGHQATADLLGKLLDIFIPVSREKIVMQPKDRALVFRLLERLPAGALLEKQDLLNTPYEMGLLHRLPEDD